MNFRQILDNLHLSCIYDFATEEERERLSQLKKAKTAYYRTVNGKGWEDEYWVIDEDEFPQPISEDLKQLFETNYRKARELIKEAMDSGILKIYGGIGDNACLPQLVAVMENKATRMLINVFRNTRARIG
jgi:predicted transglutaminase-like protease